MAADAHRPGPLAVKSIETLLAEAAEEGHTLKRAVGALSLTAIGLGAIIGTGIFIVIGAGAKEAGGAAVIVSFAIAAFACAFSAMACAELSRCSAFRLPSDRRHRRRAAGAHARRRMAAGAGITRAARTGPGRSAGTWARGPS